VLIAVVVIAVYRSQSNEHTTSRICQAKVPIGQSAAASC